MQNKKYRIQVGVNIHNQKKGGWWCAHCSIITNHFSSMSVITATYRFKVVNFLPIFGLEDFGRETRRPQKQFA